MIIDIFVILMGFVVWLIYDYLTFIFLVLNNDKLYKGIWLFEENLKIRFY